MATKTRLCRQPPRASLPQPGRGTPLMQSDRLTFSGMNSLSANVVVVVASSPGGGDGGGLAATGPVTATSVASVTTATAIACLDRPVRRAGEERASGGRINDEF